MHFCFLHDSLYNHRTLAKLVLVEPGKLMVGQALYKIRVANFGMPAQSYTMMYKIINNLVHIDQRYLSYNLRNARSNSLHLYHFPTRIDVYCHSFYPSLIRMWNNLLKCVISSTTVDLFKYRLCELEII